MSSFCLLTYAIVGIGSLCYHSLYQAVFHFDVVIAASICRYVAYSIGNSALVNGLSIAFKTFLWHCVQIAVHLS